MKPEYILQSDVLDILFEHRNKAYGAYYIRRHYHAYLLKALMAMLVVTGGILFLFTRQNSERSGTVFSIPHIPPVTPFHPVEPPKFEPPPPRVQPSPKQVASQHFASIRIVPPTETIEEPLPDVSALADKQIALTTVDGPFSGDVVTQPAVEQLGGEGNVAPGPEHMQAYTSSNVDEAAEYPGGLKAMMRFLQRNLRDPIAERTEASRISIRFVVNEDGTIGNFAVIQTGGEKMDLQVIKVLQKMPRWKAARKNGRNVAMYFVQPVSFEVLKD
ncbi:energy transducer TonB [Agriterribacter sp.]|uniref:energy transducer TonB n=1 Tax=Agriterribacter sp. TaxID=2821509 RepID=UPI002C5EB315|nr:energy transducer TonB [Agriterribacter sp.]HRO48389.1 energy transducer TonB [Agriterribacter sp.]HRQ16610.1 energy transducer TonB [Agriterribacter sp.]